MVSPLSRALTHREDCVCSSIDAAENGLDMVEVMDLPLPDEFATLGAQPREFQRSVSHLFPDIEAEALPLLK